MKNSTDSHVFHTNLLQALQKNKIIQGKLNESQHSYHVQLIKDLQMCHLKEKYNRELLYTWKKESYIRKIKKDLQEYEQQNFGVRDAHYEYQLRNLDTIITGVQSVVIPASEEKRRLQVNEKYRQFLQKNPLQTPVSSSIYVTKSANVSFEKNQSNTVEKENDHNIGQHLQLIHPESARLPKLNRQSILSSIHSTSMINGFQTNRMQSKSAIPSTARTAPNLVSTTSSTLVNSWSDSKNQQSHKKFAPKHSGLSASIEPLHITSEALENHIPDDLVIMRSVRRPKKNPSELNLLFETRKRIYEINRRALDVAFTQKQYALKKAIQFNRLKQMNSTNPEQHAFTGLVEHVLNESDNVH